MTTKDSDATMSPAAAAELLAQADKARTSIPASIPSAVVTLGILCAIGSFGSLTFSFATHVPTIGGLDTRIAVTVLFVAWILGATFVPLVFRTPWRHGLAVRWLIYMVAWALLWGAAVFLPTSLSMWVSALFISLFAIACGIEAKRARKA